MTKYQMIDDAVLAAFRSAVFAGKYPPGPKSQNAGAHDVAPPWFKGARDVLAQMPSRRAKDKDQTDNYERPDRARSGNVGGIGQDDDDLRYSRLLRHLHGKVDAETFAKCASMIYGAGATGRDPDDAEDEDAQDEFGEDEIDVNTAAPTMDRRARRAMDHQFGSGASTSAPGGKRKADPEAERSFLKRFPGAKRIGSHPAYDGTGRR
jgi:hypothetical protein